MNDDAIAAKAEQQVQERRPGHESRLRPELRENRANAVSPIWTPLIAASFAADHIASHGKSTVLGRAGQPNEVGPPCVFLASDDASYMTGQVLHPNGGTEVGS